MRGGKFWSQKVTESSNTVDLEEGFLMCSAGKMAKSFNTRLTKAWAENPFRFG